jgi:hypothetical protein
MNVPFFNNKPNALDVAIEENLAQLKEFEPGTKQYAAVHAQIVQLQTHKEKTAPKRISPDVLVAGAVNILGIVLILKYEKLDIITSRAIGFVKKIV